MTYRELLYELNGMTESELDMDATVALELSTEAIPVSKMYRVDGDNVHAGALDLGHPVISIDF
jgi:hypothetical protein